MSKFKFDLSNYINLKIFLILILAIFALSVYVRYNQYNRWKQQPSLYFTDNYPAMTTLDAYYWLRYAKEDKNGTYYQNDNDTLRAYPDTTELSKPVPLLSFLISKLSSLLNISIYKTGLLLVPILASLFIIPMSLYFYYSNMPIAGIIGSFVGTFSWMYFIRTSMGRVDTDLLQLFFLFLSSLFLFLISKEKDKKPIYLYSIFMGVTLALFGWWYAHTGIILVYMLLLAVILYINKINLKTSSVAFLLFIIFSNPLYVYGGFSSFVGFLNNYFSITNSSSGFPNILKTITEARHTSAIKVISYILSSQFIDILGLTAFAISILFLKKNFIPLLPILLLGILSFKSSERSVMFLSVFVGAGIGFILDFAANYILKTSKIKKLWVSLSTIAASFIVIFILSGFTAIKFLPRPSIAPDIIHSFIEIKHKIKYANIFSWWDYGYAIEDIDGFATYHDGGAHGGARTYFAAYGFVNDNQTKLYNTISYIDHFGIDSMEKNIKENGAKISDIIDNVTNYNKPVQSKNDYILFTRDMIGKFGAINYIGNWDFRHKSSNTEGFHIMLCSSFKNNILKCMGNTFDLNRGLIDNKIPIKRVVVSGNGYVINTQEYSENGVNLEILLKNRRILFVLLCSDRVFKTNFNQMYILGHYNKKYFKEVYNNFPSARLFRVK